MTETPDRCSCTRPADVEVTFPSDNPDKPVVMKLCERRFEALRKRRKDLTVRAL